MRYFSSERLSSFKNNPKYLTKKIMAGYQSKNRKNTRRSAKNPRKGYLKSDRSRAEGREEMKS